MNSQTKGNPVVRVAALLALLAIGYLFITDITESASTSRATRPQQTVEQSNSAWIAEMQIRVKAQLKDPDGAQFRDTYVSRKMGVPLVCGHVNANNSYGGKTGFQRFAAAGDIMALEEQMAPGEMDKFWNQAC